MTEPREHQTLDAQQLISTIVSHVWDPVEIKTLLSVALLGGETEALPVRSVLQYEPLVKGVRGDGSDRDPAERIHEALMAAVARGILIALRDEFDGMWIVSASAGNQLDVYSGTLTPADALPALSKPLRPDRPDIFGLYEQNIGMVTPIMADRLTEALNMYPEDWIRDAIGESVTYNKRNWRYIQRILENWTAEGRTHEANRRDHEEHLDSEKYIRGKYASLFRRR